MSETSSHTENPVARPWRPQFGQRSLILASMTIIGAGLYLNGGWVTAIGVAPLILALAPCAVMCGLGACVMCKSKSCDNKSTAAEPGLPRD